jgi:hypothetical protein
MAALDQSELQEILRRAYGGSDNTSPSFLRPQYVRYNGVAKSRDFGVIDNLSVSLSGQLGSQTGASTLFFKVVTRGPSRLGIAKTPINPYADRYLSVGLLDGDRNQIPLNHNGFGYSFPIHAHDHTEPSEHLPAGTYYFTISCDQWQATPFEVIAIVQRFVLLAGLVTLVAEPLLRLALIKLLGAAEGSAPLSGRLLGGGEVKALDGAAGGTALPSLTLVIMSGAITGSMLPYGRLKETFRISGVASGSSPSVATMTVTRRPGYGY